MEMSEFVVSLRHPTVIVGQRQQQVKGTAAGGHNFCAQRSLRFTGVDQRHKRQHNLAQVVQHAMRVQRKDIVLCGAGLAFGWT